MKYKCLSVVERSHMIFTITFSPGNIECQNFDEDSYCEKVKRFGLCSQDDYAKNCMKSCRLCGGKFEDRCIVYSYLERNDISFLLNKEVLLFVP